MLINLGIVAFVVTTTLLTITQSDEAGTRRRAALNALDTFAKRYGLDSNATDRQLHGDLSRQLELHFDYETVRAIALHWDLTVLRW